MKGGLVVTIGAPGSGKSTWAAENLARSMLRLERDRFREALFDGRRNYHEHPLGRDTKSLLVTETMMAAMMTWPFPHWAVTDTGLRYSAVRRFIQFATTRRVPVTLVTFPRSREYLLEINRTRPVEHRIPEDILDSMIEDFAAPDAWWKVKDHGFHILEVKQG